MIIIYELDCANHGTRAYVDKRPIEGIYRCGICGRQLRIVENSRTEQGVPVDHKAVPR